MRALIAVDGFVIGIHRGDDVSHSVTFDDLAIHAGLPRGQIRTRRRIGIAADVIIARPRLAKIVRAHALARVITSDAIARIITDLIDSANEVLGFERIGRHAVGANVLGARVVVHGQVRIENLYRGPAISVAYDAFAIPRRLHGRRRRGRSHRGKGLPT